MLASAIATAFALVSAMPASADTEDPPPTPTATAQAEKESFTIEAAQEGIRNGTPKPPQSGGEASPAVPTFNAGSIACEGAEPLIDEDGSATGIAYCSTPEVPQAAVTISDVRNAFARLKLPAAKLVIQPPDGLTLVNFDTNFYTTSTSPISRTVTLLGQRVTLEATPAEFQWTFGDGESLATTEPGAPYPSLRITHNYLQTGTYQPTLDTVFTGRYRVGGGPWQQIPGTVTIEGTGQDLRAIEAQPKLVGY